VELDNSDTSFTFENELSAKISASQPENTVIKKFQIKNIKMYWNSMSESFIPTSLWEQTRNNPDLQLFEAMDASFLRDMMHDAFMQHPRLTYNYLLEPFSLIVNICYKK
jgi:hypothetical protein